MSVEEEGKAENKQEQEKPVYTRPEAKTPGQRERHTNIWAGGCTYPRALTLSSNLEAFGITALHIDFTWPS